MNIGFVLDDTIDSSDGVQQYIKTLSTYYMQQGHTVYILSGQSSEKGDFATKIFSFSKNITIKGNKNKLTTPIWVYKDKIKYVQKNFPIDILHVQAPYAPSASTQIIKIFKNVPVVGTFHTYTNSKFLKFFLVVLRLMQISTHSRIQKIYPVSEPAKKLAENYYINTEFEIMPNVVDLSRFQEKPKTNDVFTLKFLGRLVERKGALLLIEALNIVKLRNPGLKLKVEIGGTGNQELEVRALIKKYSLDFVTLKGYIAEEDKVVFIQTADLCVFPSYTGESFGIVLIESFACGIPVIAGRNDGYATVLTDDGSQMLVDSHDAKEFASLIEKFMSDSTFYSNMKIWAQNAVKKYDVEIIGQKLLLDYNKIITKYRNESK